MLYVQLDTNWPDHPKIIAAGIDGAGLHAVCLCIAKRLNTDGWVARALLYRQGADDELIDRLVGLRLLEDGGDRVRPEGWLDRNPSQAAIEAKRLGKKVAALAANHKRWDHDGEFDTCPICQPKIPAQSQLRSESDPVGSVRDPDSSHIVRDIDIDRGSSNGSDDRSELPPAVTAEQRRQRIMEAAMQVAEERAIGRNDIGPGWIAGAARGIASDHHQALHAYLVKNPTASTLELIEDVIDAKGRTPAKTGGVTVDEDGLMVPGSGRMSYFTADDLGPAPGAVVVPFAGPRSNGEAS